jgi:hypothetical protein
MVLNTISLLKSNDMLSINNYPAFYVLNTLLYRKNYHHLKYGRNIIRIVIKIFLYYIQMLIIFSIYLVQPYNV